MSLQVYGCFLPDTESFLYLQLVLVGLVCLVGLVGLVGLVNSVGLFFFGAKYNALTEL